MYSLTYSFINRKNKIYITQILPLIVATLMIDLTVFLRRQHSSLKHEKVYLQKKRKYSLKYYENDKEQVMK